MKIKKKKKRLQNFIDCSEMFRKTDKDGNVINELFPIVQFANGPGIGDTYVDIRLFKKTKSRGFVVLTCNGGLVGFKKAMKFIIKNRKKIIKLVRASRKMMKDANEH